ncbi:hypothetical protein A3Q56_04751 [Intoshia linei]|uniref:Uncharacterized protein n=1 Tax=Intoshia linei TaxID=1819745 RepID=A0A177B196_9BILA|nr:hypothetical protein A3Q56_04751 [Intoshia linei]
MNDTKITRTAERSINRNSNRRISIKDRLELPNNNYKDDNSRMERRNFYRNLSKSPIRHSNNDGHSGKIITPKYIKSPNSNDYDQRRDTYVKSSQNYKRRDYLDNTYNKYGNFNQNRFKNYGRDYNGRNMNNSNYTKPQNYQNYRKVYNEPLNESRNDKDASQKTVLVRPLSTCISDDRIMHALMKEFVSYGEFDASISNSEECKTARVVFSSVKVAEDVINGSRNVVMFGTPVRVTLLKTYSKVDNYNRNYSSRSMQANRYNRFYNNTDQRNNVRRNNFNNVGDRYQKYNAPYNKYGNISTTTNNKPFRSYHSGTFQSSQKTSKVDEKPNRGLYIQFIDSTVGEIRIRNEFEKFGTIESFELRDIERKDHYSAYIKFEDIDMAKTAKSGLDDRTFNRRNIQVTYGKPPENFTLLIHGLPSHVTVDKLEEEFDRFGAIKKILWKEGKTYGYITFQKVSAATAAYEELKSSQMFGMKDNHIKLSFVEKSRVPETFDVDSVHESPLRIPKRIRSPVDRIRRDSKIHDKKRRYSSRSKSRSFSRTPSFSLYPPCRDQKNISRSLSADRFGDGKSKTISNHAISPINAKNEEFLSNPSKDVVSICQLIDKRPNIFSCLLQMKNSIFSCKMFLINGLQSIAQMALNQSSIGDFKAIRITQRLRLDKTKFGEIMRNIESTNNYALLIAFPDDELQSKICNQLNAKEPELQLRTHKNLATYLTQKEAAGISIHQDLQTFVFPPSKYISQIVHAAQPHVNVSVEKNEEFLLFLIFSFDEW